MSSNQKLEAANEILNYVIEKLNIKSESYLVLMDIQQDLSSIQNLNEFRIYIKENQRNPWKTMKICKTSKTEKNVGSVNYFENDKFEKWQKCKLCRK